MKRWARVLALVLLATGLVTRLAQAEAENMIGDYQLAAGPGIVSVLSLKADGTYKLFLMVGTLDEQDEGRWRHRGSEILLNSTAPKGEPNYTFVRSGKSDFPGVLVQFEPRTGKTSFYTDARFHAGATVITANEGGPNYLRSNLIQPPLDKITLQPRGLLRQYKISEFRVTDPTHNHFIFTSGYANYGIAPMDQARVQIAYNGLLVQLPWMPEGLPYLRADVIAKAAKLASQRPSTEKSVPPPPPPATPAFQQPVEDQLKPCDPECRYRKFDPALQREMEVKEKPLVLAFVKSHQDVIQEVEAVTDAWFTASVTGPPYGLPIRYSVAVRGIKKVVTAVVKPVRLDGKVSFQLACIIRAGEPSPETCKQ